MNLTNSLREKRAKSTSNAPNPTSMLYTIKKTSLVELIESYAAIIDDWLQISQLTTKRHDWRSWIGPRDSEASGVLNSRSVGISLYGLVIQRPILRSLRKMAALKLRS